MSAPGLPDLRLRAIELNARRLADAVLAGRARARRLGAGTDFEEVRAYAPGDEVRHIDWNATARADAPMVRRFRQEREMPLVLAVDVSASGDFGSARARRERIAELAGLLAFSAVDVDDPVGLLLFDAQVRAWLPPRKGRAQVSRVLRAVLGQPARGTHTDVAGALGALERRVRRPSMVALLSDLQTDLEPLKRALLRVGRRHDLFALQVTDPTDAALPNVGRVALEDPESGRVVELDTGRRRVREAYARAAAARADALDRRFREAGVDRVPLDAAADPVPTLRTFFARRAA
ncbi:MAG: DUF58 domain-containing protein [Myxococcales bacterium]|nr:DUF58 domain-containing protein [Myxococcales bacterium]